MRSSVVALSQLGLLDLPQRPKVPELLIEQPASVAGQRSNRGSEDFGKRCREPIEPHGW